MSLNSLKKYLKKRRFGETPEPKGGAKPAPSHKTSANKLAFVVQEHHASSLHYDFRLEIDGVLKSWAIPKGPSLDPQEHHLAVQTEDHPYEYRKFEGVIPKGNYGAGNVIIWDEGWYEPRANLETDSSIAENEKILRAELEKGHLTFVLHGTKLHGEFALIRMKDGKKGSAWLLIKKGDSYASHDDITKQAESVKSHRTVDAIGDAIGNAAGSTAENGGQLSDLPDITTYSKKAAPWPVKPMLATLTDEPFDRKDWLFEVKCDGYRAIGSKHRDKIQLYSRNSLDFMAKYPPVAEALRTLDHDVILDGEIVVVDAEGIAHFEWLQQWQDNPHGSLEYHIFDILWYDGHDIRTMPLVQRKQLLRSALATQSKNSILQYSDYITDDGVKLFSEMRRRGLEGMVAKDMDSPYRESNRGADWLKVKTQLRQEVVIGGYTEPRGSRKFLGSLLVGVYDKDSKDGLQYVGHSGGGIPDEQRKQLQAQLAKIERKTSPFTTEPVPNAPVHWVEPKLVCEMTFSQWTEEGCMRHPQYEGQRPDKKPTDVHREEPKHLTPAKKSAGSHKELPFEPTHLDKVYFPKTKLTKGDLFKYYETAAEYILPYIKDRPCSLNRMPDGITGEGFYQKNNEHLPAWVSSTDIFSESNNQDLHWVVGSDLPTLLYMVQLGCIEINPWNSRVNQLDNPDWLVIDLDPEGVGFAQVIEVARTVHQVCEEWSIPSYPKTSGKTGIHIFIPLHAKYDYEQAKNLAHLIALEVNARQPKLTSVERMPEKRHHKIYLDFLQNRKGQTLAAPYSVRPTPTATVSMPLHWEEVKKGLEPTDFTIKNAATRLKRTGDLWKPVLKKDISLAATLKRIPPPQG